MSYTIKSIGHINFDDQSLFFVLLTWVDFFLDNDDVFHYPTLLHEATFIFGDDFRENILQIFFHDLHHDLVRGITKRNWIELGK
jgi:hypothetical protein